MEKDQKNQETKFTYGRQQEPMLEKGFRIKTKLIKEKEFKNRYQCPCSEEEYMPILEV